MAGSEGNDGLTGEGGSVHVGVGNIWRKAGTTPALASGNGSRRNQVSQRAVMAADKESLESSGVGMGCIIMSVSDRIAGGRPVALLLMHSQA